MALVQGDSVAAVLPSQCVVVGMCRVLALELAVVRAVREVSVNELHRAADVLFRGAEGGVVRV